MKKITSIFVALLFVATIKADPTVINVNSSVTANITIDAAGDYVLQGDGSKCVYSIIVAENLGTVNITSSNVYCYPETPKLEAMLIKAGSTVNFIIDGTNKYLGKSQHSGIEVLGNVVFSSKNGLRTDSLFAQGSDGPGIGVMTNNAEGGDITINSGVVYGKANYSRAAGIGTGSAKDGNRATCKVGTITINGGYVYGEGSQSDHNAGIGCGYYTDNNKKVTDFLCYKGIVINGGVVWAKGYGESASIGCSKYLNGGNITINGGTIEATERNSTCKAIGGPDTFTGKVVVTGGTIKGSVKNPVNGSDVAVEQVVGVTAPRTQVTFGGIYGTDYSVVFGTNYGINDVFADGDGNVYFYVPTTPADVEVLVNKNRVDLSNAINITAAGSYSVTGNGSQTTNGIVVAANLGEVVLDVKNVNIAATTALQIGANTNVILNGGNAAFTGALTGDGTLTINGGTHKFQGAQDFGKVVITGGSVQTLNAGGTVEGWTNAVNASNNAVALFADNFNNKANTLIKNGTITGTDYSFDLKANYGLKDVYTSATGDLWFYLPSPIAADADGEYNTLEVIDLVANGSNELVITDEGVYQLNGSSTRTTGMVTVAENVGEVTIILNNVDIKGASGHGLKISAGNNVTLKLEGTNSVKAGKTYYTGIIVEGDLTIEGPGKLTAEGSTGAAIGGQHQGSTVGNITINGGIIEAKGSTYGAGIGLAYVGKNPNNAVVTVNGGTIWAKAGTGKCALGKSDTSSSMNVIVNGGSINALNSSGEEITMSGIKNASNADVTLFKTQLADVTEATRVYSGSVDSYVLGGEGYGMNDVYTDASGYLYFYIPEPAADPTVVLNTTESTPVDPGTFTLMTADGGAEAGWVNFTVKTGGESLLTGSRDYKLAVTNIESTITAEITGTDATYFSVTQPDANNVITVSYQNVPNNTEYKYSANLTVSATDLNGDLVQKDFQINLDVNAEGVATSLEEVSGLDYASPMYTILGTPVTEGYRGVVIQNGKKYIIK